MILNLKKKCDYRLLNGHQWVFSNELESIPKLSPGETVEIISANGYNFGKAFYNPNSLISCRLLNTFDDINLEFFINRISDAYKNRKILFQGEEIYRLVFGESDFLPGLVIDKYCDYFSIQILSAGMEKNKELIFSALKSIFPNLKGIILKNFSKLRELEGLEQYEKVEFGEIPDELITFENKIKLNIKLIDSQKTGYFLDQKINRSFISTISKNKTVLDLFCNQGAFALNSAIGGAKNVTGVDISETAINQSNINKELNNLTNCDFIKFDVSDYLRMAIEQNKKWDLIILDPPAFTKSKKDLKNAMIGYSKINRMALKCIQKDGFLATGSCSQHLSEEDFLFLIRKEAEKLKLQLKLVFRGNQSPDHPILLSMPETNYLKFFVFQVC